MQKPQKGLSTRNRWLLITCVVLLAVFLFESLAYARLNGLVALIPWLTLIGFIIFLFTRPTVPKWIVVIVLLGTIIFGIFRFFAPQSWPWGTIVIGLPLWVIAIFAFLIFWRMGRSIDGSFQSDLARDPEVVTVTFNDVGGQEKAKETLKPIIDWLKDPNTGTLGNEIPRGILLTGPSGSGKTLFARAIAGQAEATFFFYNGSEFIELFVGVAARRVRSLFNGARKAAKYRPCVVFIDQIDLISGDRAAYPVNMGSNSEMYQALAQLQLELDNPKNGRILVLAATSRPRVLDPALTTPGRLSLRVDLQLPDKDTRKKILDIHLGARRQKFDMELDNLKLDNLAAKTEGWSGAELAQMVTDAAELAKGRSEASKQLSSMNRPKPKILVADFEEAMGRLLPEPKRKEPDEIVKHLNTFVIGQQLAKKRLAVAVSNHYLRVSAARQLASLPTNVKKSNVLLVGPTGSGKTLLVETIADFLEVPYVIFNSTVLTETGYSGASVEQILYKLVVAADLQLRKAEYGIICIDEFDKLAFHQGERTRHTGAGVQQELLKIIEGTVVDVPKSGGERGTGSPESYQFNTRNILFVCLGAFNDIEVVIERRLNGASGTSEKPRKNLLKRVQPDDVINYGFIPELIGRFPVVTYIEQLTVEELTEILQLPDTGLKNEYKSLLELQGWEEPTFIDEAIKRIAEEALRRRVGARGLRGIMEEVLLDPMYERPKNNHRTIQTDTSSQGSKNDDKFTERTRKVLNLAQEEARGFQHNYVGTEHLLLGLLIEGEGLAAKVLNSLGVEPDKVRNALEFIIGRGDRLVEGEIALTPRARKVIELAADEARNLNHDYIGTGHLLLGLEREGEGIAMGILESLGVKQEKVRTQTIQILSQSDALSEQGDNQPLEERKAGANGNSQALIIDELWVKKVLEADQSMLNGIAGQTPATIKEALDQRLGSGNTQAKQFLAIVAYNHYCRLASGSEPKSAESAAMKQAVLLVDPYTDQRLQLVHELANILKVPCVTVNAELLEHSLNARSGQSLGWLFEPIRDLLQKANYDLQKAQQGMIFIDDFDQSLSKVTVHPSYSTLQQQLGEVFQGRSVLLQFGGGYEVEFKTHDLFFVLGGDFRFPDSSAKPSRGDSAFLSKYRPGYILSNLVTDFGISGDLLQHLIVVTMDLSLSEEDLERIIKQEDEQLKSKYKDLLAYHPIKVLSDDDYKRFATDAKKGFWKVSDIRQSLESNFMEALYAQHEEIC